MKILTDLFLDGFVVCLAFIAIWYTLKIFWHMLKISSTISFWSRALHLFPVKLMKERTPKVVVEEKVLHKIRSCATPVVELNKSQDVPVIEDEVRILTPLPEFRNWSEFDSPTVFRKGSLVL